MQSDPVDIIALLVALLAFITSKELAQTVGPYMAIVILACAGAGLSLSGNEKKMTTTEAIAYVGIRIMVAVSLTVALAEGIQLVAAWAKPRYTLVILAFGIGWIRDYNTVREWAGSMVSRFVTKKIDDGK